MVPTIWDRPPDNVITGRSFDFENQDPTLNQVMLYAERTTDAAKKWDLGFRIEALYGADGPWTALSRRSRSFLGSSFLKDIATPGRFLLLEYWSEMMVYEKHLADFSDHVEELKAGIRPKA